MTADRLLCDLLERGIALRWHDNRVQWSKSATITPADRHLVRANSDAIAAILACASGQIPAHPEHVPLLSNCPLPYTHWPYYSRRLQCWWLLDAPGWQVAALYVGPERTPAWRLTPSTHAWFAKAVDLLMRKRPGTPAAEFAFGVYVQQMDFLARAGLGAEADAALLQPPAELPQLPAPLLTWPEVEKRDWSINARKSA